MFLIFKLYGIYNPVKNKLFLSFNKIRNQFIKASQIAKMEWLVVICSLIFVYRYLSRAHYMRKIENQRRIRKIKLDHLRRVRAYRRLRNLRIRQLQAICIAERQSKRRIWVRPRRSDFWKQTELFTPEQWRQNFRMCKESFYELVEVLKPLIQKKDTRYRKAIIPEKRVAVALYRLTTNCDCRTISNLFGIGISTVHSITEDFISAVKEILTPKYIKFPSGERLKRVIDYFEKRRGFPQVVGLIDGSHIPIIAPTENPADYHNRKGFYSVVLQGIVSENYLFSDVFVGYPGKAHDARVFINSGFYDKVTKNNSLIENCPRVINGVAVQPLILGDPAYPLLPWLMKAFPGHSLPHQKESFNFKLSSTRMGVEHAFGRLKGRFRCLLKRFDCVVERIPDVVLVCCVLHNFCELHNEEIDQQWLDEIENDFSEQTLENGTADNSENESSGTVIRNTICDYLYNL